MRAACFLVVIIIVLWEKLVIGALVVGGVGHWPLKIKIFVNGCPLIINNMRLLQLSVNFHHNFRQWKVLELCRCNLFISSQNILMIAYFSGSLIKVYLVVYFFQFQFPDLPKKFPRWYSAWVFNRRPCIISALPESQGSHRLIEYF